MAPSVDNLTKLNKDASAKIYPPLPNDSSIRLIKALKIQGDQVELCLVTRKLDDPSLTYMAMSYVWGSQEHPQKIRLCNKDFYITQNLFLLLKQMATHGDEEDEHLIWVDALVINQTDIPERNAQVPRMRDIYARAQTIGMWLGEGNEYINHTFRFYTWLYGRYQLEVQRDPTSKGKVVLDRIVSGPDRYDPMQTALQMHVIGQLPYWDRVWIVQELMNAKSAFLHCGCRAMAFPVFTITWRYMCQRSWLDEEEPGSEVGEKLEQKEAGLRAYCGEFERLLDSYLTLGPASHRRQEFMTISQWLAKFSRLGCTNPRDLVFGYYGCFPPDIREKIEIDYSKDIHDVFINMLDIVVHSEGNLEVLLRADMHAKDSSFPSWLPNFHSGAETQESIEEFYTPSNQDLTPDFDPTWLTHPSNLSGFSIQGNILKVQCLRIGTVNRISPFLPSRHDIPTEQIHATYFTHIYRAAQSLGIDISHSPPSEIDAFIHLICPPAFQSIPPALEVYRQAFKALFLVFDRRPRQRDFDHKRPVPSKTLS